MSKMYALRTIYTALKSSLIWLFNDEGVCDSMK